MPAVPAHFAPFQGLWIPLVTPFQGGAVDHPALATLTAHLATQGVAGFVACGSTGEAAALDKAEQLAVLETVLRAAQGLPVVMGLSGYHLGQTVEWVTTLAQYPLAGLLVPAPHYIRPSQEGLLLWFSTLADASRDLDEAERLIEIARAARPNDPAIADSWGWLQYRRGHLDEAERVLRSAWAGRKDAEIGVHLGEVLWQRGKRDEAMRVFDEVRRLDPQNASLEATLQRLKP